MNTTIRGHNLRARVVMALLAVLIVIRTAHDGHLRVALIAMAMLAATLVGLVGAKPAEAKSACFPEGHDPIAFEHEGDIWVASIMQLVNR